MGEFIEVLGCCFACMEYGTWKGSGVARGVVLGVAFVDNWAVGKEKVGYWLSNDIVGLVENLAV